MTPALSEGYAARTPCDTYTGSQPSCPLNLLRNCVSQDVGRQNRCKVRGKQPSLKGSGSQFSRKPNVYTPLSQKRVLMLC